MLTHLVHFAVVHFAHYSVHFAHYRIRFAHYVAHGNWG